MIEQYSDDFFQVHAKFLTVSPSINFGRSFL